MARSLSRAGPLAILLVLFFSAELAKAARLTTILDDHSESTNGEQVTRAISACRSP